MISAPPPAGAVFASALPPGRQAVPFWTRVIGMYDSGAESFHLSWVQEVEYVCNSRSGMATISHLVVDAPARLSTCTSMSHIGQNSPDPDCAHRMHYRTYVRLSFSPAHYGQKPAKSLLVSRFSRVKASETISPQMISIVQTLGNICRQMLFHPQPPHFLCGNIHRNPRNL